ncbi:MAG: flagellin, partial [Terracidiphilus sp.]
TIAYGNLTLNIEGSTGATASTTGVVTASSPGTYKMSGSDTITSLASTINNYLGANVASVQGNQLVLSGGATWTTASGNINETMATNATATSLTVGNASDVITPGAAAISFTPSGGTAQSLGTIFGAAGAGGNLSQLASAINTASIAGNYGVTATVSGNKMLISGGTLDLTGVAEQETANNKSNQTVAIFTSDGTISQSYNNSSSDLVAASSSALQLAGTSLTSTTGAQAALTAINAAITSVAADRGTIGANINTLTAVENVMNTQSTNTLSAENDVTATDYGQATSDMSKYQILTQTGIAALSQANQSQQLITKLLQ